MLKDKRTILYNLLTSIIISVFVAIEEVIDNDRKWDDVVFDLLRDIPLFWLTCAVLGYVSLTIIQKLNIYFPWKTALLKRFLIEIFIILSLVVLFTVSSSAVFYTFWFNPEEGGVLTFAIISIFMFFIGFFMLFAFYEFIILSEDNELLSQETSELQKQNYITRYEALKNQVNPHFLFNSLNVLSSLIYKDVALSDQFIRKFSEVFRYVLELNQEQLVPLKRELKFLESFFFLQQMRYGNCLKIKQKIDASVLGYNIPPMALQVVIENAIKHNIISKEYPLTIELYSENNTLYIRNNYQLRNTTIQSTGIGQKNLFERYKMLNEGLPDFYLEDGWYVAQLPLVDKNHVESTHY